MQSEPDKKEIVIKESKIDFDELFSQKKLYSHLTILKDGKFYVIVCVICG